MVSIDCRPSLVTVGAVFALAGCDPLVSMDVEVVATPELQAAIQTYPVAVVVTLEDGSGSAVEPPRRVGVLCQRTAAPRAIHANFGGVGCAKETRVSAFVVPLAVPAGGTCESLPPDALYDGDVSRLPDPLATGVLFAGVRSECGNHRDYVKLEVGAPAK
jgi:hypothetical protein